MRPRWKSIFAVLGLFLSTAAICQTADVERLRREERMKLIHERASSPEQERLYKEKMKETVKSYDTQINLYGIVSDQFGNPVEGAEVQYHISQFTDINFPYEAIEKATVKTNEKGLFEIVGERGFLLFVADIAKPGYEYSRKTNLNVGFDYRRKLPAGESYSDPERRVSFVLRKRGETTILYRGHPEGYGQGEWSISAGEKKRYLADAIEGYSIQVEPVKEGAQHAVAHVDLEMTGEYVVADKKYHLKITMAGGGGILASDKLLYQPPEEAAFFKEAVLTMDGIDDPKLPNDVPVFLYLKVRKPPYFVRMDGILTRRDSAFDTREGHKGICYFRFVSWTNPYGERCVEDEPDIADNERLLLEKEAAAAIKKGNFATKPDIKKLVEEYLAEKKKAPPQKTRIEPEVVHHGP